MRGKGKRCCSSHCRCWVHPRTCGEKSGTSVSLPLGLGSPPHMQGKGRKALTDWSLAGFTPAHAGKRANHSRRVAPVGVHPRTCGEKGESPGSRMTNPGSPPHMRGKAAPAGCGYAARGFTPAHAGKRKHHRPCWLRPWVHPRTCGEKAEDDTLSPEQLGSPPHMRGKACHTRHADNQPWVHPHTCGEKTYGEDNPVADQGSPPHMRGKGGHLCSRMTGYRFTPAHAGKSKQLPG